MVLPMKFYTTLWWKEINTERRYDEINKQVSILAKFYLRLFQKKYQSDYVSIYAMFLQELNHDDKLKDLYEKLKKLYLIVF